MAFLRTLFLPFCFIMSDRTEPPLRLSVGLALLVFHSTIARRVLDALHPHPSNALLLGVCTIALINFTVKVLAFVPIAFAPRARAAKPLPPGIFVSVIFPAYNEADGIADVVRAALASTSSENFEVIVVDDRSKDSTWKVLQQIAAETGDKRLVPVAGAERGKVHWQGKNWAVWQGFQASRGTHLLFADADLTLRPGACEAFVATLEAERVGWLSFLPKTRFSCFAEFMFNWPGTCISQALIPAKASRSAIHAAPRRMSRGGVAFDTSNFRRIAGQPRAKRVCIRPVQPLYSRLL